MESVKLDDLDINVIVESLGATLVNEAWDLSNDDDFSRVTHLRDLIKHLQAHLEGALHRGCNYTPVVKRVKVTFISESSAKLT